MYIPSEVASQNLAAELDSNARPAALLTLTAFQDSPWAGELKRAIDSQEPLAQAVFDGMAGLYWAFGADLPQAETFEEQTKDVLSSYAVADTSRWYDPHQLNDVATHLRDLVNMWVTTQPAASQPSLTQLVEALHAGAGQKLDAMHYRGRFYPFIDALVRRMGDTATPAMRNALARQLSDDAAAPPVTVRSEGLNETLDLLRQQYRDVIALDTSNSHPGRALLWEVLAPDSCTMPVAVRSLLLRYADSDERTAATAGLELEVLKLAEWEPAKQTTAVAFGEIATGASVEAHGAQTEFEQANSSSDALNSRLWELVEIIQSNPEGRKAALDTLYSLTYKAIFRYVIKRIHNIEQAQDTTGGVYVRVLNSIDRLHGNGKIISWMYQIAHNLVYDYHHSSVFRKTVSLDALNTDAQDTPFGHEIPASTTNHESSPWAGPEAAALSHIRQQVLLEAIGRLPNERQKTALRLRFFADMELAAVAKILNMTLPGFKSLQLRAINNLRTILRDSYPSLVADYLDELDTTEE